MTAVSIDEAVQLALQCHRSGRLEQAESIYRQILSAQPNHPQVLLYLGLAAEELRRPDAADITRRATEVAAVPAHRHNLLGNAAVEAGQLDRAIQELQHAITLDPIFAPAHNNLGNALAMRCDNAGAVAAYRSALKIDPRYSSALFNLAKALFETGDVDAAVEAYEQLIAISPNDAGAYNSLGIALGRQARTSDALAAFRRAIELDPNEHKFHSNLLYMIWWDPTSTDEIIAREHARWRERFVTPLKREILPHQNNRDPSRRLRVGYVSPNLWAHVIGLLLEPTLENHDHSDFEIFCYATQSKHHAVTARFKAHADHWRDVEPVSDAHLAQLIRDDEIDLLIDPCMHMANNRMLMFARKPAPVQISYMAYPETSGLPTMDYRLTCPLLDPPGALAPYEVEKLFYLPETLWAYRASPTSPPTNELPAVRDGVITFGCLNNPGKINNEVATLWARVLGAVPDSRLAVLSGATAGGNRNVVEMFAHHGIDRDRIQLVKGGARDEYLAGYHDIDIALDTFPYNGHTTTLDTLWMGVPVVTLPGGRAVGRFGELILTHAGLSEFIARDANSFVRIAGEIAADLPRLAELRRNLRSKLETSVLMDAPRFTRFFETALREMWRRWCDAKSSANL